MDVLIQLFIDEKNPERYSLRLQESDYYDDEINGYELNQQVSGIKHHIFHLVTSLISTSLLQAVMNCMNVHFRKMTEPC